jgi:hypothetical protein
MGFSPEASAAEAEDQLQGMRPGLKPGPPKSARGFEESVKIVITDYRC